MSLRAVKKQPEKIKRGCWIKKAIWERIEDVELREDLKLPACDPTINIEVVV